MSESSSSKWIIVGMVIGLLIGGLAVFLISPSPDISGYQEQIEQLETQVTTLQDRAQDLEEELEDVVSANEYTTLENQLNEIKSQLTSLQDEIDEKEDTIDNLQKTISELEAITPTLPPKEGEPGSSMFFPADIDTPITCVFTDWYEDYSAQITIKEVIRGTTAWSIIHDTNMFNEPPLEGYEYVLVKIKFKLISAPTPDTTYWVYDIQFDAVSSDGLVYVDVVIVNPEPSIDREIRENQYAEGWAVFQVYETDDKPILVFEEGGAWFKLYE